MVEGNDLTTGPESKRTCSECDGTGVIETFTGFPGDGPDRDYCDACGGTGKAHDGPIVPEGDRV